MKKRPRLTLGFDRFSALYLWAIFIAVFGIWTPSEFLSMATVHSVASSQAVAGIIALAVLLPLACGQFDLSVGATANLCGIVAITLQADKHWSMATTIVVCIAIGTAIGAVNGFIVVKLRVSSFIATLGMGSILAATQEIATGGLQPQPVLTPAWNKLTQTSVLGFQSVCVYLVVLAILVWWFMAHSPAGRYIDATGNNADAARLSGVRVGYWSFLTLTLSGTLAGIGGILFTSLTGPSLTFGPTLLLPAFAATFLGSTQLRPGRFNVWGTLIAIYVLATGVEGLNLVSGAQWLSDMFNGVAVIVAVALSVARQRKTTSGGTRPKWGRRPRPEAPVGSEVVSTGETPLPVP
jgi:ribose transport system permease protein